SEPPSLARVHMLFEGGYEFDWQSADPPSTAIKWLGATAARSEARPVECAGIGAGCAPELAGAGKPDITREGLGRRRLAERGLEADTSTLLRFNRRIGVTFENDPRRTSRTTPT
ncbi:MAG: hypothetical protein KGQ28_06235, partial [Hyphomicrobiales bacterium]|nr:hypothetical protein [Hyphomicrobiales bacterium]